MRKEETVVGGKTISKVKRHTTNENPQIFSVDSNKRFNNKRLAIMTASSV